MKSKSIPNHNFSPLFPSIWQFFFEIIMKSIIQYVDPVFRNMGKTHAISSIPRKFVHQIEIFYLRKWIWIPIIHAGISYPNKIDKKMNKFDWTEQLQRNMLYVLFEHTEKLFNNCLNVKIWIILIIFLQHFKCTLCDM